MNKQEKKLVSSGMKAVTKAYHKLGYGGITELDPNIKEAFTLLDQAILDLKEFLGYERSGDWNKLKPEN